MQIAIMLYDRFTSLDAVGPYEVLSRLPGAQVKFVSVEGGPVTADTGMLTIQTACPIAEVPSPDLVLVPGGPGDEAAIADRRHLDWLRKAHETTKWTTSVCTGSIILAAAGLLEGLEATTHWARYDALERYKAKAVAQRFVRQGKIVTAAGVSAGIDMALMLAAEEAGEDFARSLQLAIEYDPQPPFEGGSPAKTPKHIIEMLMAFFNEPSRRQPSGAAN